MKQRSTSMRRSDSHEFRPSSVSLIFFLLDSLSEKVYHALVNGFFGKIFTAYSVEQKAFEQSFLRAQVDEGTKVHTICHKVKEYLSRSFEESFFIARLHKMCQGLLTIPLKAFGNFFLSFGIYTILIYFLKLIIPGLASASLSSGLIGLLCCVIGFPLILSRVGLAQGISESRFAAFLAQKLFGFRKESLHVVQKRKQLFSTVMLIAGMVLGLSTFILPPGSILIGIGACVALVLLFVMPEIGVVSTILLLPFFSLFGNPSIALGFMVLVTAISYMIKFFRGKRLFQFELIDLAVLLFGLTLFFSGTITAGGREGYHEALISCILLFGYFLTVNLMRTKQWLNRCTFSLVFSGTVTAILGIFQYLTKNFQTGAWLDLSQFSDIEGRVDALFENPNMLAFYLVIVLPFALSMTANATAKKERLLYVCADLLIILCVILTWSRGAWLAVLAELFIFFLIYSKKTIRYLLLLCFAVPFVPFLLPEAVVRRFVSIINLSDSSILYRLYTWAGSANMVSEHFWGGIGYGTSAYRQVYPQFAYAGMESAVHSHNLLLQIMIGMGIGGLLLFLAVTLLFFQMTLEHLKHSKNRENRLLLSATLCVVIAMLVTGCFDFVWYNYRIFYLFWVAIGLGSACIRVGREEMRRISCPGNIKQNAASMDLEL